MGETETETKDSLASFPCGQSFKFDGLIYFCSEPAQHLLSRSYNRGRMHVFEIFPALPFNQPYTNFYPNIELGGRGNFFQHASTVSTVYRKLVASTAKVAEARGDMVSSSN